MTAPLDIIIRQARLRSVADGTGQRERADRVDIGVTEGRIAAVAAHLTAPARTVLDAAGQLVTGAFVNPHLHLDKVYTLDLLGEDALRAYHGVGMREAASAIALASRVKARYDRSWIIANVRRALDAALRFGVTRIRAFADVDRQARLEGVHALLTARAEYAGRVDLEVVAFPQDGVVTEPGAADLVRQAVALGADVVGGIPWIEGSAADQQRHIDQMFDIAAAFDRPVSMLVDDAGDAQLHTLEMLARTTMARRWHGRVLAHHARALALYPPARLRTVAALLRDAGVGLVVSPHTGPLHAPVRDLRAQGVRICLGQDDISDAYYPLGRNNMLEVAFLAAHLLWMTTRAEMEVLYDMITRDAAEALGAAGHVVTEGAPAHLVVLGAPSVPELLRSHDAPRYVISHGRVVAGLDPAG